MVERRAILVFSYLAISIFIALNLNHTPDEISRLNYAEIFLSTFTFDFHWPPGSMILPVIVDMFGGNVILLRISYILIFGMVFYQFLNIKQLGVEHFSVFFLLLPIMALLVATSSPQGILLFVFIGLQLYRGVTARTLLLLLLMLTNPLLLPIVMCVFLYLCLKRVERGWIRSLFICLSIYFLLTPITIIVSGTYSITYSSVGPLNLFLGNNASPLSYRGFGTGVDGSETREGHVALVYDYLMSEPRGFFINYVKKLVYFWSPADNFRSGIFQSDFAVVVFSYILLCQVVVYYYFLRLPVGKKLLVGFVYLSVWMLYAVFFVKLRFRLPFDLLIYVVYFATKPERNTMKVEK